MKLSAVPVVVHCLISRGDASPTVMTMLLAYNRSDVIPLLFSQIAYSYCINEICQQQIVLSVMAGACCIFYFSIMRDFILIIKKFSRNNKISLKVKARLYEAVILSTILYSAKLWTLTLTRYTVHCTIEQVAARVLINDLRTLLLTSTH